MKFKRILLFLLVSVTFGACASTKTRMLSSSEPSGAVSETADEVFRNCVNELHSEFKAENASSAKQNALFRVDLKLAQKPFIVVDGVEIDTNQLIDNRNRAMVLVYVDPAQDKFEWSQKLLTQCKENVIARIKLSGF